MKEEVYLVGRLLVLVRRENMRDQAHSIALQSVIRSLEAVIDEVEEHSRSPIHPII